MKRVFALVLLALIALIFSVNSYASCYTCELPNTPPGKPSVYITPAFPEDDDDLYCHAYSYDADNDTIVYHYQWYKNDSLFRTYTTKSNSTSISRAYTSVGDVWKCVVKAYDGEAYSEENYDSVTISAPESCEDFELSLPTKRVSLSRDDSASINFWVKNLSSEGICLTIEAKDYSPYISASPSKNSVCLSAYESKLLALTITTIDAPPASYTVKLRVKGRCLVREEEITVIVEQPCCAKVLEVIPIKSNICQGEKGIISVLVRNRSNRVVNVKLEASSNGFVARFKQNEFELDPRQELYAELEVYAEGSLGEHYVYVYARSDHDYVKKKAWFNIVECPEVPKRSFALEVPTSCIDLQKNQEKSIAFSLKNLLDSKQKINLQTVSDIISNVEKSVTLEPNQKKTLYVKVYAKEYVEPGKHYVRIYAWNSSYREKKELCIDVKPMRKSRVVLEENYKEIEQCSFGVYTLTIENQGDLEEEYEIRVNNPTKASIKLSDSEFSLKPKSGKEVFITVNVPEDMPTGDYNAEIIVENEDVWVKTIYFKVVRATRPEVPAPAKPSRLMVVSYPVSIAFYPGEQREASLVLYNPSENTYEVTVTFDLPEGFTSQKRSFTLGPEESKTIVNVIEASGMLEPGKTYFGRIKIEYDGKTITKALRLHIEYPPEEISGQAPVGFALLSPEAIITGILIIAAFVLIIIMIKNISAKTMEVRPTLKRR